MKKRALWTAAALLLAQGGRSSAQERPSAWGFDVPAVRPARWPGKILLSYNTGWAMREGPGQPAVEGSLHAQVAVDYQWLRYLATGLEFGYSFGHKLKGKLSGPYQADVDADGRNDALSFDSDVRVKLLQFTPVLRLGQVAVEPGSGRINHYVTVGGGYYRQTANAGTASYSGQASSGLNLNGVPGAVAASRSNYLGFNFGMFLGWTVREGMSAGVEARYHYLLAPGGGIRYIIPAGRLTFWF